MITKLVHNRIELVLHELRAGEGRPLLLLHGLGERAPESLPAELAAWPGPVHALDFTGHGGSTVPHGGGYTAELLMGDADVALQHLGEATVVGRGLGGYVALLIGGGRPKQVRGVIVRDGPGLAGGGAASSTSHISYVDTRGPVPPDPFAMTELSRDVRPRDYAASFARQTAQFSVLQRPITICALERPEWVAGVLNEIGVEEASLDEALAYYASPGSE